MDTSTRQTITVTVTRHSTAVWLENVLRSALMDIKDCPKFIVSDHQRDLSSLLKEYVEYFNQNRPHQSLE
jgi:hypothetical protein